MLSMTDAPAAGSLMDSDAAVTSLFQTLASPVRLAVLRLLLDGERCVGDLLTNLPIAQPRLSNHLACLRACGLVQTVRRGTFVYYAIADPRLAAVLRLGEELAASNPRHLPMPNAVPSNLINAEPYGFPRTYTRS